MLIKQNAFDSEAQGETITDEQWKEVVGDIEIDPLSLNRCVGDGNGDGNGDE